MDGFFRPATVIYNPIKLGEFMYGMAELRVQWGKGRSSLSRAAKPNSVLVSSDQDAEATTYFAQRVGPLTNDPNCQMLESSATSLRPRNWVSIRSKYAGGSGDTRELVLAKTESEPHGRP